MKLLYLRPSFGGIHDYSLTMASILGRIPQIELDGVTVSDEERLLSLLFRLWRRPMDTLYLELGSHDRQMFWMAFWLMLLRRPRLVVTVHDPKVLVQAPIAFKAWSWLPSPVRQLTDSMGRYLRWWGHKLVRRLLARAAIIYCLNADTDEIDGLPVVTLPFPVYVEAPPMIRSGRHDPPRIAYTGYWGPDKGLETLVDAIQLLVDGGFRADFIISGWAPKPGPDAWCEALRLRFAGIGAEIELPGFIPADVLDDFIGSLDLLVIPYWPALAAAASANAMRALQAGIPVVATRTPALLAQLGPDGAFYAEPKDAASLAAAIRGALADDRGRVEMARRNQARLYREHSWARVAEVLSRTLLPADPLQPR